MLVPSRFSNLKYSLLFMTSLVIDYLVKNSGVAPVADILYHMREVDDDYSRDDVLSSVTFLFALGKVEYDINTDNVKYIGGI
ncbi:ABC-three component system middle component 8 [Aeromonas veronii]|uniref:ABC-three component system middle component 8 n=1 Tax=Aeromonas veronii TaxID=654 RepID=UPI003BA1303F